MAHSDLDIYRLSDFHIPIFLDLCDVPGTPNAMVTGAKLHTAD